MRRGLWVGFVILLLGAVIRTGDAAPEEKPGGKPYTPTRMEWLVTQLNAYYRSTSDTLSMTFIEKNDRTVEVRIVHGPDVEQATVNRYLDLGKRRVRETAKTYGWDWVTTSERADAAR